MDIQKIEPLLMDYALGATNPEVAELINAVQEKDANVHGLLQQWRGIAASARQAMQEKAPLRLPQFPQAQLEKARRRRWWRQAAIRSAALAACLMLGYFLGIRGQARTDVVAAPADLPVAAVEDFWSQARLRSVAEQDAAQSAMRSLRPSRNPAVLLQQFGG